MKEDAVIQGMLNGLKRLQQAAERAAQDRTRDLHVLGPGARRYQVISPEDARDKWVEFCRQTGITGELVVWSGYQRYARIAHTGAISINLHAGRF